MPEQADDAPSRLIAERYRLETMLGTGSMGTVWSGVDELLRRPVAIKEVRLPPGLPEEEAAELRERALREARAIAVVTHPNVVTLYDVAREKGEPFVVMELVPSQSLATIVREHGALAEPQLAVVADGVAAALEAAHRNGIIHRDVKPGNVLIGDDGRIKLSDFGISRNTSEQSITRSGIMLGTPAFIAPEIASGEAVSASADLWGLGATLFAASEGRPPYDSDGNPMATVTSVVHGPVPLPSRTGPIADVITGLMVKDAAGRMSLQDVRRKVRQLLPETGSRPFEMLLDPDAPTVRVRKPASTVLNRVEREPEPEPAVLASDPGPLPFTPSESPAAPRRSVGALIALGISAALVFALGATGGFAATRALAGQSVVPPLSAPPPADQAPRFVRTTALAQHSQDNGTGRFEIAVPQGWTMFQTEQDDLANNKTVYFVSPDGQSQVAAQRFGGFYQEFTTEDYLEAMPELVAGSSGDFRAGVNEPAGTTDGSSGEADLRLTYTTVESVAVGPPGGKMSRDTTVRLMRRGADLWLLRVTGPVGGDAQREALLNTVLPSFRPLP